MIPRIIRDWGYGLDLISAAPALKSNDLDARLKHFHGEVAKTRFMLLGHTSVDQVASARVFESVAFRGVSVFL